MKNYSSSMKARRMARLLQETCLSTPTSRLALTALVAVGVLLPLQANAANFNVGTEAQLRNAISTAANGDTITFTADIALTAPLPNLQRSVQINGANFTLSGANHTRVLYVQSGTVDLVDLKIVNGRVVGGSGGNSGSGGGGGGGAAGLGGALYIASTGAVTATNVSFNGNRTDGGSGGHRSSNAPGGGGGGGGTSGSGANGNAGGAGGAGGGGNGSPTASGQGQPGGFGGGGGGGGQQAGAGGFGGGGGGGGGSTIGGTAGAAGGFGGGNGNAAGDALAGGGGGAGLGGAIFVQEGGQLAFNGTLTISGNNAHGGNAGSTTSTAGEGHGTGLFLHGSGEFTVAPAVGETQTIQDTIADQKGVSGSGGSWTLDKQGAGTTILLGFDNAYSGGIKIKAGILQGHSGSLLGNIASTGGTIVFDQRLDGTYAGNMTGAGAFTKTGLNTLKLTGNNTYSGATTVTGGTLLLTSATSLSGPGGVITLNNGTIGRSDDLTLGPATVIDRAVTLVNDGGFVVQSVRNELTVSSVIDGGGRLVKSGVGTLVLTGTNTYAGGTMVNGGLVSFATDANLGAAGTGITLDGGSIGTTTTPAGTSFTRTVTLMGNGGISVGQHPITWAGNIVGPGQLIKSGNGELELTGANTYGGGTLVQRGTLRISSDDKLGFAGSEVTLQENGALRASETFTIRRNINLVGAGGVILVDGGKTLTLNGIVSGSNILKVGDGTVILDGANTYTGTTQVSQGILQGNSNTIRGNVAFDETVLSKSLVFDQAVDGTFAGNIAGVGLTNGNGSVVKNGAGTLTLTGTSKYTGGTTVNAGTLQGTTNSLQGSITNNAAVIFNQSFDGTYAGNMTGTGTLTKNGSGKVTITGTNNIGGGTTINAGGFAVNGSLTSNVTLNGGILSGAGNITGDITQNGGEIAPGNSIGTITINGNYTVRSGILEFEINSNGQNDKINVVGAGHKATLQGGTIEVLALAGTYRPNSTYTLISAAGGVVGKFDRTTSNLAFLTPSLSYDANNVYISLALASNAFASAGQTQNQQAVGGALDAIAASGNVDGIVTVMANLPNGAGAPALQALSGQPYADFGTLNLRASQLFMNSVGRQMATERGAGLVGGPQRVALAEACVVTCDTAQASRFSAWFSGIGSTGSVLGDANASGLTYTLGGTAFGIDYRPDPRFLVGIAGGYTSGTQWVNGFSGNGYSDAFSVALYGSYTPNGTGPGFYADALVGYANANNRMQRVISLPGNPTGLANGNTSANQFLGQVEVGYKFGLGLGANTSISPFARLQVGSINQAGFTEYGGGPFNLSVAAQNTTSVRTTFGVDLAGSFDIGGGTLLDLGLRLGWMHEFADTARPMTAAFAAAPGSQFTVLGATPQRDSAVIGFSAATALSDRTSLFVSYDGEIGGGTDNHSVRAGFKIKW